MEKPWRATRLGDWDVHAWDDAPNDPGFYAIYVGAYTVLREKDGSMECSCKGWYYRQSCKHVQEVQDYIERRK